LQNLQQISKTQLNVLSFFDHYLTLLSCKDEVECQLNNV